MWSPVPGHGERVKVIKKLWFGFGYVQVQRLQSSPYHTMWLFSRELFVMDPAPIPEPVHVLQVWYRRRKIKVRR